MTLGERLKVWRTKHGLTQTAAAERAGVKQPTWADWENNKKLPLMDSLPGLTRALGEDLELHHLVEAATPTDEAEPAADAPPKTSAA